MNGFTGLANTLTGVDAQKRRGYGAIKTRPDSERAVEDAKIIARLRQRIAELETALATANRTIADLQADNDKLAVGKGMNKLNVNGQAIVSLTQLAAMWNINPGTASRLIVKHGITPATVNGKRKMYYASTEKPATRKREKK